MSGTLLTPTPHLPAEPRLGRSSAAFLARTSALPTWVWLTAIALSAAATRGLLGLWHTTPRLFPDEYIYSSLSRSLSEGNLTIRGEPASFPAILEPLLTAPAWLANDIEVAYRLTQLTHVFVMSLAVFPVYFLARRVELSRRVGLLCGAIAVMTPTMIYSTYVMAEPVAYPLALGAVAAAVATLDGPSRRNQATFLALAFLTTLARVQFVVLVPVIIVAAIIVDGPRPVTIARRYWMIVGAAACCTAAVVVLGSGSALGYYKAVLQLHVEPISIAHWMGIDAMLLVYASGIALVPCALLGVAANLGRGGDRGARAFAAMTTVLAVVLIGQAALYASNGSERFMERYLFYLTALVPIAFFLGLRRLPRGRSLVIVASLGFLILTMRIPLTGYTVLTGRQDSPLLAGIFRLESALGFGGGSLAVAIAAAALCLVALAIGLGRFRYAPQVAIALTVACFAAVGVASFSQDRLADRMTHASYSLGSPGWVDAANLGSVAVLSTPGTARIPVQLDLFWNRSLARVLLMHGADEVDVFGHDDVSIRADGRIVASGRPVQDPVLVEESGSRLSFDGARLVARRPTSSLWQPSGALRAAWIARRFNADGWWEATGSVTIWPRPNGRRTGTLVLPFRLPAGYEPMALRVTGPGVDREVSVGPATTTLVRIPVDAATPVSFRLSAVRPTRIADGRVVVAHGDAPRFVPSRPRSRTSER